MADAIGIFVFWQINALAMTYDLKKRHILPHMFWASVILPTLILGLLICTAVNTLSQRKANRMMDGWSRIMRALVARMTGEPTL